MTRELNLSPRDEAPIRLELAVRFLQEGRRLVEKDPVQASQKLYKAAEECVKGLALQMGVEDLLSRVKERGRWTVTELEKAVHAVSREVGAWFREAWDSANYLHVWGFHEAKLNSEAVGERIGYVERIVKKAAEIIKQSSIEDESSRGCLDRSS